MTAAGAVAGLGGAPALFDTVARIARHEVLAHPTAAIGVVTEAFPAAPGSPPDHAVSVQLRDTRQVMPRVPIAVGVLGFAAIPAVGDLVLVVFCDGDHHAPVVAGRLYHPDADPPGHADGQVVLALPSGASSPALTITVTADPTVTVDFPDAKVTLALDGTGPAASLTVGDLSATLDGSGSGQVEVKTGGATFTLTGSGDVTLSAQGTLTLEGAQVQISAQGQLKVKGATVEIN